MSFLDELHSHSQRIQVHLYNLYTEARDNGDHPTIKTVKFWVCVTIIKTLN